MSGAYAAAWFQLVERSTCDSTGVFSCAGPGILMLLVGVPVAYVVLAIGLRIARTPLPWLAPMAVAGALVLLAELAELVDLPLWLWPVVVAALCAAWAYGGTRVARA